MCLLKFINPLKSLTVHIMLLVRFDDKKNNISAYVSSDLFNLGRLVSKTTNLEVK